MEYLIEEVEDAPIWRTERSRYIFNVPVRQAESLVSRKSSRTPGKAHIVDE